MKTEKKYIQTIISANNDNSLAVFVGAGISKSSETKTVKLPSWNDLIEDLKDELEIENESDFLKIAQLYYLAFGEFIYYKKLKEYFPEHISPSIIHKLIFDINPHVIITTNWDSLLEKTIQENAYIYDVVCSDIDLVKSSLQNKLIKMHGDFKNHNIVFKEDDYLKYNLLFPLVENYVKSILSTHTVVFIGYSYNDTNLKQIVKWIQNYSNVKPPMYLITYKRNDNQIKYMENHGITTIVLEETDNDKFQIKDDLDDYSKKMLTFLSRILTKDEVNVANNSMETIDFILNKLETLNELDGILIEQIQIALTNCGYIYDDDSTPILEFYDELLTYDINKPIRAIHEKFREILYGIEHDTKKPLPKILKIFEILRKARIKGIVISKNDIKNHDKEYIAFQDYLKIEDLDEKNVYFDFDFKVLTKQDSELDEIFELALKLKNLDKIEEAFAQIEDTIKICLKQRNYTKLFIAMFNRNILLHKLKFSFSHFETQDKYKNIKEYNLKERYQNLTKDLKFALEPIYEFVDFSFLYRYAYRVSNDLRKKEEDKRTIKSGGMIFNSDVYQFSSKHENLVNFVLKNKIMIEDYNEYKSINKSFVSIALIRQIQKETVTLSKTELYSCIKYIDYKDLRILFDEYYDKNSTNKGKLELDEDLKGWLINTVFENITKQYLSSEKPFNGFEHYIKNTMFILSLLKNNKEDAKRIFAIISKILKDGKNTLTIFESINLFMGIQHNLYKLKIDKEFLINMIETFINKLVYKKFTGHEYIALTRNELSNLYGYASLGKVVFQNEVIIDKLLTEVKTYAISEKIQITQNFILNIYEISTPKIKDKIKRFTLSININDEEEIEKRIIFENTLVIFDFKELSTELAQLTETYLEQYKDGSRFSTILYMLDSQIDYLIANKSVTGLEKISEILKTAIKRHKESNRMAIF
ncbi:NAD-dependent protein deacetylase, SIR2 family [Flavobacterium micromati]|uniref:NAD-dependent protein deacetylase, SIR2 family n=1 Tax=Flavobacterium micromati TaxID=229205 RepID=A0A1M5P0P0_9FLAO|nr:SIR2 family protein [Flavobacterium micromati]SHG94773.1 NAD-dependent protein deacetylase, SIR2 family [Flavobacterium micromati]